MLPDLVGGAEAFGLLPLKATNAAIAALIADAPPGAAVSMHLLATGPAGFDDAYDGFNMLLLVNQVIGDTCGPAGMMMALRSIPAYLRICREMQRRCPGVVLFNHSNPMAPIMRALHKYTAVTSVGVCHGVQGGIVAAACLLDVPPQELDCTAPFR